MTYEIGPDSAVHTIERAGRLSVRIRSEQSSAPGVVVKVDVETSLDGRHFAVERVAAISQTLPERSGIYVACYETGEFPTDCHVRLRMYATGGSAVVSVWIAGRSR